MCRFDSEGDGFNGGMTRREPGDVVGIPITGRLGREIVRERGSYDMNSIEMMLKLMLVPIKVNDTKKSLLAKVREGILVQMLLSINIT